MRELIKSLMRLPWALSMFGTGQAPHLLSPATGLRRLSSSFDALSRAAEQEMGESFGSFYRAGDHFQSGLVDTLFAIASTPPWDPSGALTSAQEAMESTWMTLRESLDRSGVE